MGFAQGLAAGERSGNFWGGPSGGGNPYAMMPAIGQALQKPTRGLSAGRVHSNAATMALKEKELDQKQQIIDLKEQELLMAGQKTRWGAEKHAREAPMRGIEAQHKIDENYRKNIKDIESRGLETEEGVREGETHERTVMEKARQDDFAFAQWGLSARNPEPIVSFFKKYGDPKTNIESVEFGPQGTPSEQEIVVKYEGQDKAQLFKSPEEFFKGLMAFGSPELQKHIENMAAQGRLGKAEKRKDAELGLKISKEGREKGALSKKQRADVVARIGKQYDDSLAAGGKWASADKAEIPSRDEYIKEQFKVQTGEDYGQVEGAGPLPATEQTADKATGKTIKARIKNKDGSETFHFTDGSTETRRSGKAVKQTAPGSTKETGPGVKKGVKTFKDPDTGNVRTVYPGGVEVIRDSDGKTLAEKEPGGEWIKEEASKIKVGNLAESENQWKKREKAKGLQTEKPKGDDEKIDKYLDEEAKKKPEKKKDAPKKAKGLPDKKAEAKKEGEPASSQSASYVDPKTGKTVTKKLTGDASKAGAKIKTTKKKKKKKKKK